MKSSMIFAVAAQLVIMLTYLKLSLGLVTKQNVGNLSRETTVSQSLNNAVSCTDFIRQNNCSLPYCRCSDEKIPGNLLASQVPQFVFLTFDDALNHANYPFYLDLISNRKNPNGHPISLTFFVSHEYTNYPMIHQLYRNGHEIALHSISHKPYVSYWSSLNTSGWKEEIYDQSYQLSHFAKVPLAEIRGMRAPFLQGGGDSMFQVLQNSGSLLYDCSRPTDKYMWPYTHNFASTQECNIPPCAQAPYPGLWTVPMIKLVGKSGSGCSMVDSCLPLPTTDQETFEMFQKNFLKHLHGNRAPFGIYLHSAWLQGDYHPEIVERRRGYLRFLDYLATLEDVYIVSISRALEWVKAPTPLEELKNMEAFQVKVKPDQCARSTACSYKMQAYGSTIEKWFHSCAAECPKNYPWVGNPLGE